MRKTLMTVAAAALTLAGCGEQSSGTAPSGSATVTPPATSSPAPGTPTETATPTGTAAPTETVSPTGTSSATPAELTIVVDDGAGATTRHTLTCAPEGGDHPNPQAACAALADPALLEPVPEDARCTAMYGGPQTATVTGTRGGTEVDAEFRRTDGCQTARWDAAAALLGIA